MIGGRWPSFVLVRQQLTVQLLLNATEQRKQAVCRLALIAFEDCLRVCGSQRGMILGIGCSSRTLS